MVALVLGSVLLYNLSTSSAAPGSWDASSWADRRQSGSQLSFSEVRRKMGQWSGARPGPAGQARRPVSGGGANPEDLNGSGEKQWWEVDVDLSPEAAATRWRNTPRPPTSPHRTNATAPRTHRGKSRVVVPKSNPEKYMEAPLPTLDQAFAHLKPRLVDIKEREQSIPREHELWQPIFPPFLTPDLQERFWHLRAEWDEEAQEWVESGERRWLLVTVCRQVAGMLADWFSAWTVLADFLGPETLVFSLLEGDSADGRCVSLLDGNLSPVADD